MMNAHFCAAVPNLRIMETDIDRIAWDHELFDHVPEFVDGHWSCRTGRAGESCRTKKRSAHVRPRGRRGLLNTGGRNELQHAVR